MAIILGDFNYNLLNYSKSTEISDFLNTMLNNLFLPYITGPTFTQNKPSLIDNIFHNNMSSLCSCGCVINKISDHLPNFIVFEDTVEKFNNRKEKIDIRDISKFSDQGFIEDIDCTDLLFLQINNTA